MKTRVREIAKAGIFGSLDNPQIVTEKELLEIAETFPDIKTAPITFGHWSEVNWLPRTIEVIERFNTLVGENPQIKNLYNNTVEETQIL